MGIGSVLVFGSRTRVKEKISSLKSEIGASILFKRVNWKYFRSIIEDWV